MKANKKISISLMVGSSLSLLIILIAILAPLIFPEDPMQIDLNQRLMSPNAEHIFGTDEFGGDIFLKVAHGTRLSLSIASLVILISFAVGSFIGAVAGYLGGITDLILMRVLDIFYAVPNFLICLCVLSFLPPSKFNLVLALSLTTWVTYARLIRGEVLSLKEMDFVEGVRALGGGWPRILMLHITPNLINTIIVHSVFTASALIITESGLSFLGLGAGSELPSWGSLLYSGKQFLAIAPHVTLFPALAICVTILGLQLLAESLQKILNPRSGGAA